MRHPFDLRTLVPLGLAAAALPLAAAAQAPRSVAAASTAPDGTTFAFATLPTGVRLRYAEQGIGRGETIVLLHGYSDSWFSFSRVLPILDDRHHLIAVDLRGHGGSDQPESGYSLASLAADVIALLDRKGIERAVILGHSMGSLVAQQVALAAPARVSRLVLVGSAVNLGNMDGAAEFEAAVNSLTDPVPVEFLRSFQESTVSLPLPEGFIDRAVEESKVLTARVWKALLAGMLETPAAIGLAERGIPTLAIWGGKDAIFLPPERDAVMKLLGNARRIEYPGTGHAPHWEQPERFAADVEIFLSGK